MNIDSILPKIGMHHKAVSGSSMNHVSVRLIVTAESKAAGRRIGGDLASNGACVLMAIRGCAQRSCCLYWQNSHGATSVICNENIFPGRVDTQMSRARSFRTHDVQKPKISR